MRRLILVFLLVGVAACAGIAQPDTRQHQFQAYVNEITRLRDSGQITSLERITRMKDAAIQLWGPPGYYDQELWSFATYIATERDGGMSKEQAEYLMTQKQNEIRARMQADYARTLQVQQLQQQQRDRERAQTEPAQFNPLICSIHEVSGGMGYGMCFR